jgi:hypothetical protein
MRLTNSRDFHSQLYSATRAMCPGVMTYSRAKAKPIQDELDTFCNVQKVRKCSKDKSIRTISKRHRSKPEISPYRPSSDYLSNKTNNVVLDYKTKNMFVGKLYKVYKV